MAKYRVLQVSMTWFSADTSRLSAPDLFMQILGTEPDNIQRNKLPNPGMPFTSLADGEFDNHQVQIMVQPGRVDLFIRPTAQAFARSQPIVGFRLDADFGKLFEKIVNNNGSCIPAVYRFGFQLNVAEPTMDEDTARRIFFQKLDMPRIPGLALDLNFQINVRKTLSNGEQMNKLVRHSVEFFQMMTGQMSPFGPMPGPMQPYGSQEWALIKYFDFNTVPNSTHIEPDRIGSLILEIYEELTRAIKCELISEIFSNV